MSAFTVSWHGFVPASALKYPDVQVNCYLTLDPAACLLRPCLSHCVRVQSRTPPCSRRISSSSVASSHERLARSTANTARSVSSSAAGTYSRLSPVHLSRWRLCTQTCRAGYVQHTQRRNVCASLTIADHKETHMPTLQCN